MPRPKLRLQARHQLFPQVHRLVDAFIRKKVKLNGCDPSELGLATYVERAVGLLVMILWTRRAADPSVRVAVPALVGGIAIPVALYLSNPWLAMIAVTICACGVLSALPGFWSLPTAAAGIGLVNSLGNLSGFVAPYVTGALADATGNNRIGLWVVGICMLSAAAVTWALRRSRAEA